MSWLRRPGTAISTKLVRVDRVLREGLDPLPHLCNASPPRGQFHTVTPSLFLCAVSCFPRAPAHLMIVMVFHVISLGVTMGTHSSLIRGRSPKASSGKLYALR